MIDAHAHLNDPSLLPQIDVLLARMQAAGVSAAAVVGSDVPSSRCAVELAHRYPDRLRAVVGMHPHESKDLDADALAELQRLAGMPGVVAYGEIGLDYHYDHSPRTVQREALRRQLAVALACALPIVIHEREAVDDVLEILAQEGALALGGMWHCCSTEPAVAVTLAQSFYIGIAGWITFPKAENIRAIARAVPLSRLLVETDAPYLTPVPHRGKRNEPAYVALTAAALAREKEISVAEVDAATTRNTLHAFPRWTPGGEGGD